MFHAAAARWNADVQLRLVPIGTELRPELAEGPAAGEVALDVGAIVVFVQPGLEGVVDAGEHNVLTVARGVR